MAPFEGPDPVGPGAPSQTVLGELTEAPAGQDGCHRLGTRAAGHTPHRLRASGRRWTLWVLGSHARHG